MKTFKIQAAQGDMLIRRIDAVPSDVKTCLAIEENGKFVLSHSETGHHHVIEAKNSQLLVDKTNEFIAYLSVKTPCEIEHLRSHDTHEAIKIDEGIYEIRRQREYTPEGFRRAAD